ncbi:AI-2E family transporter [Hypericibacter adhaerens]|uniref:AI-2E family transporter n=1 Tax=Hypericibacter adhaerens TaxID=2602016 RepID=A0A5J6N2C0_9PROT|nr:AI-2E family transporter [Hypericibacter adhaerens]
MRFWLIGFVLLIIALYFLRSVLLPFVAGMAIAYFLDPLCDRIEKMGCSRTWATTIVTALFLLAVIALAAVLLPPLEAQIVDFFGQLPSYIQAVNAKLGPLVKALRSHLPASAAPSISDVTSYIGRIAGWGADTLGSVLSGGFALANLISLIFITPIVTFYLLRDWDKITMKIDLWLPRDHAEEIRGQLREIDRTLAGFARGQATVCLCLAFYYGVGLSLIGLDFGLVLGLIAGVLSFIPFVGSLTALFGSIALALAQFGNWQGVAMVVGLCAVGQVIEGNFLTPKLVGDRVRLHPVWVIFALLAGGALFGFVGLLLAVPVAAVGGVLARYGLGRYLGSDIYRGLNPPADGGN